MQSQQQEEKDIVKPPVQLDKHHLPQLLCNQADSEAVSEICPPTDDVPKMVPLLTSEVNTRIFHSNLSNRCLIITEPRNIFYFTG